MDAITAARVILAVAPTVKKIAADRKAIKAARAERQFFIDMKAATEAKNTTPEPIRVTCERLA